MTRDRSAVAHVLRRLSMGPQPDRIDHLADSDAAIARALDLTHPAAVPPTMTPPADFQSSRPLDELGPMIAWWIQQMQTSQRLVEERLIWFWHDHFATSVQKVRVPYLMWQQHLTIRAHATGSFADLLKAVSKDPAMLVYLDGVTNAAADRNENFGREVMELFTLGRGNYTEQDVVAASQSFTGWVVDIPGRPAFGGGRVAGVTMTPWQASFVPRRHDVTTKTLLGASGPFDMDGALDVLLGQDATSERVATKLYTELVGRAPSRATRAHLAKKLRKADWEVMPLVEAIVADPAFVDPSARNAKVRTPLEKLVGLLQAFPVEGVDVSRLGARAQTARRTPTVGDALRNVGYVPFAPPNVGGFPKGSQLLGPHRLVHSLDLLAVYPATPAVPARVDDLLARLGLFDVDERTHATLSREGDPARRFALAVSAPEYSVT